MNPTDPPPATAYTVSQVAATLQLPIKQVYGLCRSGRLGHFRAGKHIRIPVEALTQFRARATHDVA